MRDPLCVIRDPQSSRITFYEVRSIFFRSNSEQ